MSLISSLRIARQNAKRRKAENFIFAGFYLLTFCKQNGDGIEYQMDNNFGFTAQHACKNLIRRKWRKERIVVTEVFLGGELIYTNPKIDKNKIDWSPE